MTNNESRQKYLENKASALGITLVEAAATLGLGTNAIESTTLLNFTRANPIVEPKTPTESSS